MYLDLVLLVNRCVPDPSQTNTGQAPRPIGLLGRPAGFSWHIHVILICWKLPSKDYVYT